jgi:hypothetical protein
MDYKMNTNNSIFRKRVALGLAVCLISLLMGCESGQDKNKGKLVFFPPPPDKPRLQFLKSFSAGEDLGMKKSSFSLEDFILGAPEVKEEITTPYGLDIFDNKIYVCDVTINRVIVLDLVNQTFSFLGQKDNFGNPVNIYIESDGIKYVADNRNGTIMVFDRFDRQIRTLGKDLSIAPMDVAVRGNNCYITDGSNQQVVVVDKNTGQLVTKIGEKFKGAENSEGEFSLISDLDLDKEGHIYVTDRVMGTITRFDASGKFVRKYAGLGRTPGSLARAKGIALDRENRIWVVDTAPEVAKIYNNEGQLLLFFGFPGNEPGMMNMPATVTIDYDNVEFFRQYAVEGSQIEFLVLITNQYGFHKISVYGFGEFPEMDLPEEPPSQTEVKSPVSAIPDIDEPANEESQPESEEKSSVE